VGTVDGPPLPLHAAGSFRTLRVERWRLVCAVNNRRREPDNHSISTNDAWDRIARMLFPDELVRAPTKHDVWLIDQYRLSVQSFAPHPSEQLGGRASTRLILEIDIGELCWLASPHTSVAMAMCTVARHSRTMGVAVGYAF